MSKTVELSSENFQSYTEEGLTVVDFWAKWCGPCRMMAPVLERVAEKRNDVKFAKVDVDENGELATAFNVSSIPNLCIFKDGVLVDRIIGLTAEDELIEIIDKHI